MSEKKNIIYINGRFLTQKTTGVQRYAIEVTKQLDKIESDYRFVVLAPKKGIIQSLELTNIEILNIGNLTGHLWEQISLPLYIIRHNRKAKLLNMCNIAPILFPGYTVIHDISFKTHPEHLSKKFSLWYRFITKLNIKRYNHIFTVSEFSKNEILDNYHINKSKVSITYNSAEHVKKIKPDNNILTKFGLKDKDFYFSLGSKSPHKNHKYIVECAKNNPEELFVVSGNNSNVFKNENDEKQYIKNLIYTGYLTDEEIVALYKNCKAFIFPSLYEGFGVPPLEALECGCKNIILSDIPVFREIYRNGVIFVDVSKRAPAMKKIILSKNSNQNNNTRKTYLWGNVMKEIIEQLTFTH